MMMPDPHDKKVLRAHFRAARAGVEDREAKALAACQRVMDLPLWQNARTLLLYMALPQEMDIAPLMEDAWARGKRVALPRCAENPRRLELFAVDGYHRLVRGTWGIWEPDPEECPRVLPKEVDLAIIPVVAMDDRGVRLGNGGGYYDRLMPHLAQSLLVGFDEQRCPALPSQPHDALAQGWVSPTASWIKEGRL